MKRCSSDARSKGQTRPLHLEDVWSRDRDGRASLEGPFQAVRKDSRYLFFPIDRLRVGGSLRSDQVLGVDQLESELPDHMKKTKGTGLISLTKIFQEALLDSREPCARVSDAICDVQISCKAL